MNQLPHLSILHQLYLTEEQPFRKVHRMIDLFESIIKTHTVVILAGYVKHNKLSDKAKGLLSQGLRTPSLGTWQLFSRVLFEELSNDNNRWISNSFAKEFNTLEKALQSEKTNVIAFRNGYAHGATPTDVQCVTDIQKFDPFLKQLMQFEWLMESSLVVQEGKVWISTNQESLCLHPILLYRKEDSDASYAFFNDLKNDKIGLLNYTLSKHYKEKELFAEFHEHLPLHEWKKSGNNEFYQRIEELTETFKGRTLERDKILQFILQKSKGYFSIQGNPGIGKSALIAQILKDLRAHSELKNIKVIEYFIRRGTQQAQVEYLLNYLIRRTDEVFEDGRDIRAEGKMVFDLQNQLFLKWRLWGERNNGQQLLFLIDGLDEGVENNLVTYLPRENFENILFIYGSRPGGHKSIDDLWGQLPVLNHTKLELSGLGLEDIRALIYEVANKYELDRESPWIDAVQIRSQGNPLYLKLLCDAIENGSISLNDIKALPKKIDEYYKAILLRYAQDTIYGDALLTGLFTFAAAKDYLTFAHLGLINQLGQASIQRIGSTLKEVLIENPLTEDVLDFQLFHESFREYLVRENQKQISDATDRIINFCINWKELSGTWEQCYALEHLAVHLSESKKADHHELLLELIYDQNYVTQQKKILKKFDSSAQLFQLGLLKASELDKFDFTLESALCLVDLHYEEANDAPQIVEMVANGDIDLALKRIERFGGNDQEGMKRKFILYMLCLMELTLLGSKDKPFKKSGIQKLLNHLDEQVPRGTSLLNWGTFFPSYLIFIMSCEWEKHGLGHQLVYDRTYCLDSEKWISENGPYTNIQFGQLLNRAIDKVDENINLKVLSIALSKQDKFDEALECTDLITEEFYRVEALSNISKIFFLKGNQERSTTLMMEALESLKIVSDEDEKYSALYEITSSLAEQDKINEALDIVNGIDNQGKKSIALSNISTILFLQEKFNESELMMKKAIECAQSTSDEFEKNVRQISCNLAKQGKIEEAIKFAQSIKSIWEKNIAIEEISSILAKQGKIDEALELYERINNIAGNKSLALISISNELFILKEHEKASYLMNEALFCTLGFELWHQDDIVKNICNVLIKNGKFEELASVLKEVLKCQTKNKFGIKEILEISFQLSKQGKPKEANLVILEALELANGDSYALSFVSNLLFLEGNREEAALVLNKALNIVKSDPPCEELLKSIILNEIYFSRNKPGDIKKVLESFMSNFSIKQKAEAFMVGSTLLAQKGYPLESSLFMQYAIKCAPIDGKSTILILAKQGKFNEAVDCVAGIVNERIKGEGLVDISTEYRLKGENEKAGSTINEAIKCAYRVKSFATKDYLLKKIAIELTKQNKWGFAEQICLEIQKISIRQDCWKAISESDWKFAMDNVQELKNEEAKLFYLKGLSSRLSPNETDIVCFKRIIPFLAKDSQSVENLLQAYALNQLMLGRPTKEQVKRFNKTLNLQWAIDIVEKFPKEVEDGRFSHNLENWIHEIVDEDERDQIELWARQVLKGKISEEDFKNNLENI